MKLKSLTPKQIILTSIAFHFLAVFFSEGFHKLDEQTGILRFVAFKLGSLDLSDLTAEYQMQIRPWLQPFLYYLILAPLKAIGLENPFTMAAILRFLMGVMALHATYLFFKMKDKLGSLNKEAGHYLWLLWLLPFFHVRTTAENFGTILFLYALYFAFNKKNGLAYFLFYLAFTARYQMIVMVAGFFVWQALNRKLSKEDLLKICLGTVFAFSITTVIDYWGYGEFVLAPWQYYKVNIIEGFASSFGEAPWYYYLKKAVLKLIPPGSLLFLGSFFYLWIRKPLSLLSLLSWPFFVVHCFIGHKELRFLFPLIPFIPFALSFAFENVKNEKVLKALTLTNKVFIPVNAIVLCVAAFKPAYSQIDFLKTLYKREITQLLYVDTAPRTFPFYLKRPVQLKKIQEVGVSKDSFIFTTNIEQFDSIQSKFKNCLPIQGGTYTKLLKSLPLLSEKKKARSKAFVLWECS